MASIGAIAQHSSDGVPNLAGSGTVCSEIDADAAPSDACGNEGLVLGSSCGHNRYTCTQRLLHCAASTTSYEDVDLGKNLAEWDELFYPRVCRKRNGDSAGVAPASSHDHQGLLAIEPCKCGFDQLA